MREAPQNWTALMGGERIMETRIDIADHSYYGYDGNSGIWELTTSPALFNKFSVGNCYSAQINLTLVKPEEIPKMSKMEIYVRLTNGTTTTEWVRKGVFFIDTREWDAQHEFLTITGYDAMLMAEQPYFESGEIGTWPKTDTTVVSEICTRLNLTLDSRTVLNKGYQVQTPLYVSDGSGDSLRSVLGWIGAMYGGNWCITDEGELRLVPLQPTQAPEYGILSTEDGDGIAFGNTRILVEIRAGEDTGALDLTSTPAYDPIGVIHLVVSEEAEYTAGTSGREITIQCPWGTQAMANNLLTQLQGYSYQPLEIVTATKADPLWELGDLVYAGDYTTQMITQTNYFSHAYTCDISAPSDDEIDHEYPYQDKGQKEIKREIAKSTASLKVGIDEITAQITNDDGNYTVMTLDNQGKVHIGNQSGLVEVDGASLKADSVTADKLNITGAITFSDLDSSTQYAIEDAYDMADEASTQVGRWTYGSTTYIDGTKLMTGTVTASEIQGGTIEVLGSNGVTYGEMYAGTNRAGTTAFELYGSNGLRLTTDSGLYLAGNGHSMTFASYYINCASDFVPNSNNTYDLGTSSFKWSDVYATNGTIQTSDRQVKTNIVYLPEVYSELFSKLRPVSYKFVDGHRTHLGFIAQEVEDALVECGLTGEDFAGFVKTHDEDGNTVYALRYTEFIAMNTMEIQKLKAENEALKERLDRLEALIDA